MKSTSGPGSAGTGRQTETGFGRHGYGLISGRVFSFSGLLLADLQADVSTVERPVLFGSWVVNIDSSLSPDRVNVFSEIRRRGERIREDQTLRPSGCLSPGPGWARPLPPDPRRQRKSCLEQGEPCGRSRSPRTAEIFDPTNVKTHVCHFVCVDL